MDAVPDARGETAAARVVAAVAAALALGASLSLAHAWVAPGTMPGARSWLDTWPLGFLLVGAGLAVAGAVRRATWTALALTALAWAFPITVCAELPVFPSSFHVGDGPALVPVYLLLALLGGLHALGIGSRQPLAARACALLVFWTTANGKMFTREGEVVYALIACGVLLLLANAERRWSLAALFRGASRGPALVVAAFLGWCLLAAWFADNTLGGLRVWVRLLTGALLAWTLAGSLDGRGARHATAALVAGLVASFALLAAGTWEAAQSSTWARLAGSRLRLFDLHANGIGPLFASGAVLCLALAAGRTGAKRAGLALLALLCSLALWRTESRASALGFGLALAFLVLAWRGWLPRTARSSTRLALGALAALLVGAGLFASPLAGGLRAKLHGTTQELSAFGQRYHFWEMAIAVLRDHPLVGNGPAQYYAHTRYAQPSYYDGTAQDLHTHDLPLAIAEGSGWVGLALFLALLYAVYELGRRAVAAAPGRAERAAAVALLAALTALLGSNLLDLGQSQTTFVPLLLWIVLGLAACLLRGDDDAAAPAPPSSIPAAGPGWPRAAVLLSLMVPLVASPLAGLALLRWGKLHFDDAKAEASLQDPRWQTSFETGLARYEQALAAWPGYERPAYGIAHMCRMMAGILSGAGQPGSQAWSDRSLDSMRRVAEGAPGRAKSWFTLGRWCLEFVRPKQAEEALLLARELDPLGPDMGNYALGLAWHRLLVGQRDEARAFLLEGMRLGGSMWDELPRVDLDRAEEGDARRLAFGIRRPGAGEGHLIPFDEVLGELVDESVELARSDVIAARRLVGFVVDAWRAVGRPDAALEALERYSAARPEREGGLKRNQLLLLGEAGRLDEALAIVDTLEDPREQAILGASLVRALFESDEEHHRERARELSGGLVFRDTEDIFFTAGIMAAEYETLSLLALDAGDFDAALRFHESAIWDRDRVLDRVAMGNRFYARTGRGGLGNERLVAALERLLFECSLDPSTAGNRAAMAQRAENLMRWWEGPLEELPGALRGRLDDTGAAGALFLEELEARLGAR